MVGEQAGLWTCLCSTDGGESPLAGCPVLSPSPSGICPVAPLPTTPYASDEYSLSVASELLDPPAVTHAAPSAGERQWLLGASKHQQRETLEGHSPSQPEQREDSSGAHAHMNNRTRNTKAIKYAGSSTSPRDVPVLLSAVPPPEEPSPSPVSVPPSPVLPSPPAPHGCSLQAKKRSRRTQEFSPDCCKTAASST